MVVVASVVNSAPCWCHGVHTATSDISKRIDPMYGLFSVSYYNPKWIRIMDHTYFKLIFHNLNLYNFIYIIFNFLPAHLNPFVSCFQAISSHWCGPVQHLSEAFTVTDNNCDKFVFLCMARAKIKFQSRQVEAEIFYWYFFC